MDWEYIDTYTSLPDTDLIICDTRDFHILCADSDGVSKSTINTLHAQKSDNVLYRRDEILGYLKSLELASNYEGQRTEWRFLLFNEPKDVWFKYLRFLKVGSIDLLTRTEPVYIGYVCTGGEMYLLDRNKYNPEDIDIKSMYWD